MDKPGFYKKQIQATAFSIRKIEKIRKSLMLLRLILFLTAIIVFYVLFEFLPLLAAVFAFVVASGFLLAVLYDFRFKHRLRLLNQIKEINENELKGLESNYTHFFDGAGFINHNHPFSYDLDIFGSNSLYQYINRSKGLEGKKVLADWLNLTKIPNNIIERQEAVKELINIPEWRQMLHALNALAAENEMNREYFLTWISDRNLVAANNYIKVALTVMPALTITAILLSLFFLPAGFVVLLAFVNFWIVFLHTKKINSIHQKVARLVVFFEGYSQILSHVENISFNAPHLNILQKIIKIPGLPASARVKQLSGILAKLDYRLNILISIPLNLIFLWDLQYILKLEKWKTNNREHINKWFQTIGEIEALSSLANLAFNNPDWCFPAITHNYFTFSSAAMGHPLIREGKRVLNDFNLNGTGKIVLVTGSNMAGKTTFLRTIGINLLLANTGSAVCAANLTFSPSTILTSMRITDSLADNTSSFYAELKKLKFIIDYSRNGNRALLLMDEILRGTNSNDRHIGSKALILQLIKLNAVAILATHDLTLAQLENENREAVENYNFDVSIIGEELHFDYTLKKGKCNSLNASLLMKKMGIEIGPV